MAVKVRKELVAACAKLSGVSEAFAATASTEVLPSTTLQEGAARGFLGLSPFAELNLQGNTAFTSSYLRFCSISVAEGLQAL